VTGPDDHARFEELAVGHALSALEPEDEQVFVQHLASCTACQRDVREHQEALAVLALSADPVQPPPSVLEGIRAGMAAGGRSLPPSAPAPRQQEVTSLAAARERRAGRTTRAVQWVGAAAAAALVLSLGAWNLALRSDRDASEQYGDRLAAAVRDLARPDSTSVPLESAADGSVVAVAVVQDSEVSLVVDGLEPNSSGTSYVLWAQDATGGVRPVGAFDVEQSQVDVVQDLPVEGGVATVTRYLVSQEQGDEAPATPAGDVLASSEA
jgi:hypothetical protein